mmetsp:Transcript_69066/g.84682  ORF Transcript_69066/g.84682 Transcript_69066/m.84682 type:complete len:90 (+) Transcript_69066:3-272(+)
MDVSHRLRQALFDPVEGEVPPGGPSALTEEGGNHTRNKGQSGGGQILTVPLSSELQEDASSQDASSLQMSTRDQNHQKSKARTTMTAER